METTTDRREAVYETVDYTDTRGRQRQVVRPMLAPGDYTGTVFVKRADA